MKIISAAHVLTMNKNLEYIADGAVLINGQTIAAIDKREKLIQQ